MKSQRKILDMEGFRCRKQTSDKSHGMLGYRMNGIMGENKNLIILKPIIPIFCHSIIPFLSVFLTLLK